MCSSVVITIHIYEATMPNLNYRRLTFSARQRENRSQTPVTSGTPGHRRKSRSPDTRVPEDPTRTETNTHRKRRKQNNVLSPSTPAARSSRSSVYQEDTMSDRGRKPKRRSQPAVTDDVEMHVISDASQSTRRRGKSRRKERTEGQHVNHPLARLRRNGEL